MKKILIADDEAHMRLLVRATLEDEGYEIVESKDGKDTLEAVSKEKPDLVILDVMMPEMSGLEVLEAMKKDSELKDIPVIILTAKTQESDREAGLAAGANYYLTKPFSPLQLLELVNAISEGIF